MERLFAFGEACRRFCLEQLGGWLPARLIFRGEVSSICTEYEQRTQKHSHRTGSSSLLHIYGRPTPRTRLQAVPRRTLDTLAIASHRG